MVFAARKKQLIAIQFKYFGRAYGTEEQRSVCVNVTQKLRVILSGRTSRAPGSQLPVQRVLDQQADLQLCHGGGKPCQAKIRTP